MGGGSFALAGQVAFHSRFVIGIGLAADNAQGARGAAGQAGPQTVAVSVRDYFGLAVHQGDGPFGAIQNALAAAVTKFFIYFN